MKKDINKMSMEELEQEYKRLLAEEHKKDIKMLNEGYKYKLVYWIHSYTGGDDTQKIKYYKTKPTDTEILKLLKNSVMKNDYCIIELKEENKI